MQNEHKPNAQKILELLKEETGNYNQALKDLQENHRKKTNEILASWAAANAKFRNGDIIGTSDGKVAIRIEKITGATRRTGDDATLGIRYEGQRLDRELNPLTGDNTYVLFDDEPAVIKIQ